jgi:glycosyltransferase involved in cell wall biosynthesis
MNTLCYMQPHRSGGVARHAIEMVAGLAGRADIQAEILASAWDLRKYPAFRLQATGMRFHPLPLPGKLQERLWKLTGCPSLRSRCRGFDAIYSPAEVRLPECGVPRLVTIHDVQALEEDLPWSPTPQHRHFRRKWLGWLPKACREASRILTVSEFSKQRMMTLLGVPADKIVVIGNGVSRAFFSIHATPTSPAQPVVVVVGGLREKKGAAAVLAVAAEISRRGLAFAVHVYGQHEPRWIDAAKAYRNIRLHGYAADDVVAGALGSATALLFLSPYEGFGIPALEAMAAGAPAIVANAASLPEVVGDAGIVVDPADILGIVDVLERLFRDASYREHWVAKGRTRAADFTWDRCVDRLVGVLREVTG